MNLEILYMGGYGIYVWSSFLITTVSCLVLYIKTKRTLKKYEKEFLAEIEKLPYAKKNAILEKSKLANHILVTRNKAI